MIITNITIDLTIDALLIVSCSYLFNSISGHVIVLTLCSRKYKGCSEEEKPWRVNKKPFFLNKPLSLFHLKEKTRLWSVYEFKKHNQNGNIIGWYFHFLFTSALKSDVLDVLCRHYRRFNMASYWSVTTLYYIRYIKIMKIIYH